MENIALNGREIGKFLCLLIADIGFFADNAKSRAGHIGYHHIGRANPSGMLLPTVCQRSGDGGEAKALSALLNELQLMGMDVAGDDLAVVITVDGDGEGLAAGCGTNVQYVVLFPALSYRRHQSGSGILHGEHTVAEQFHPLQIARTADLKAALQPRMGRHFRARGLQSVLQLLRLGFHGVGLHRGGDDDVIAGEVLLCLFFTQNLHQALHQPQRMAIADAKSLSHTAAGQRGQIQPVGDKLAQHSIHHAACLGAAMAFRHLHRLVNGGAVRHLVHKEDLIGTDAENIQNEGLQLAGRLGAPKVDVVIQIRAVLNNTVSNAAAESGITVIETVFGDGALQAAVRPSVGCRYAQQHLQRCVAGGFAEILFHTSHSMGWPAR